MIKLRFVVLTSNRFVVRECLISYKFIEEKLLVKILDKFWSKLAASAWTITSIRTPQRT